MSDFAATGELSGLKHNYRGHALITGEYGTSVGFNPPCPIDFEIMTDDEILNTQELMRLIDLPIITQLLN